MPDFFTTIALGYDKLELIFFILFFFFLRYISDNLLKFLADMFSLKKSINTQGASNCIYVVHILIYVYIEFLFVWMLILILFFKFRF